MIRFHLLRFFPLCFFLESLSHTGSWESLPSEHAQKAEHAYGQPMCDTYVTTSEFRWKKVVLRSESELVARGPISMASENRRNEEIGSKKNYRGAKTNF